MFGNGHSLPHGLNLPSYTEIENTQTTNGLSGGASPFVLARFHDASFFSTADLLAVPLFWAGAQRLRRQREAGGCWRPRHGQQANIAINRQRHSSCRPWLTSLQTLGPEHVLHVPAKLWAKSSSRSPEVSPCDPGLPQAFVGLPAAHGGRLPARSSTSPGGWMYVLASERGYCKRLLEESALKPQLCRVIDVICRAVSSLQPHYNPRQLTFTWWS